MDTGSSTELASVKCALANGLDKAEKAKDQLSLLQQK